MFDPKNKLHFHTKSARDKYYEIIKTNAFIITLSDKEKQIIDKCRIAKHFSCRKDLHKHLQPIYEKLLIFKDMKNG